MSLLASTIRRLAAERPRAPALIGPDRQLSYSGLEASVAALAAIIRSARIRRLALMADNGPDWIIADLACLEAGITVVPVPLFFTERQVGHLLADAGIDAVLADTGGGLLSEHFGFEERSLAVASSLRLYRRSIRRDTPLASRGEVVKVTYTSGSTGEPRGVCLSLAGMEAVAGALVTRLGDIGVARHLNLLPLATLLENIAGVYAPLMLGATVHTWPLARVGMTGSSGLDVGALRHAIDETGAHSVILLPQMLHALNLSAVAAPWSSCPLRFAAVGGASVAPAELALASAQGIPAFEGYGLSECYSVVALNAPGACREGSVGRPLPHVGLRIAADGEVLVSGSAMLGYLDDDTEPAGEIRTGDLGHLDDDGFLYVTGRKKNLFITSFGRNVAPEWVERELLHEPAIGQALVWGEALPGNAALVVPGPGCPDAGAIQAAIDAANARLPDYARVAVWMLADEPFTPQSGELTMNGRPRRERILERYRDRLEALVQGLETPARKVMNA